MGGCSSEAIFQLIEGELEPAREEGFKAHLKKCAHCRGIFQELAPVVEAFQEMDAPVMRPSEVLAMRQRILDLNAVPEEIPVAAQSQQETTLPAAVAAQPSWHMRVLGWAAIFLFGLIALAIGFVGGLTAASRIADTVASEVKVPERIRSVDAIPPTLPENLLVLCREKFLEAVCRRQLKHAIYHFSTGAKQAFF